MPDLVASLLSQTKNLFPGKIKNLIKKPWHNNENITAEINCNGTPGLSFLNFRF